MKKEVVQSQVLADSTRSEQDWSQSMFRQNNRRKTKSEQRNDVLGCLSDWNSGRQFLNLFQNEEIFMNNL